MSLEVVTDTLVNIFHTTPFLSLRRTDHPCTRKGPDLRTGRFLHLLESGETVLFLSGVPGPRSLVSTKGPPKLTRDTLLFGLSPSQRKDPS